MKLSTDCLQHSREKKEYRTIVIYFRVSVEWLLHSNEFDSRCANEIKRNLAVER